MSLGIPGFLSAPPVGRQPKTPYAFFYIELSSFESDISALVPPDLTPETNTMCHEKLKNTVHESMPSGTSHVLGEEAPTARVFSHRSLEEPRSWGRLA